jgi:heme/copper-type cytochrome/quinol oxidase subunit 2
MKLNFTRMLALFFAAYVLVTILAAATTEIYGSISKLPPPAPGLSPVKAPVFLATVPYHVLIMLIVWTLFALIYFKKARSKNAAEERAETRNLAFAWLALAIIVDFVGFVLIKHPYSLSAHAFYVDYQPWISLIYLAIFLSPWIRLMLVKSAKK